MKSFNGCPKLTNKVKALMEKSDGMSVFFECADRKHFQIKRVPQAGTERINRDMTE